MVRVVCTRHQSVGRQVDVLPLEQLGDLGEEDHAHFIQALQDVTPGRDYSIFFMV